MGFAEILKRNVNYEKWHFVKLVSHFRSHSGVWPQHLLAVN